MLHIHRFIVHPSTLHCVVSTHSSDGTVEITVAHGCVGRSLGVKESSIPQSAVGQLQRFPLFNIRGSIILYIVSLSSVHKSLSVIISLG